MSSGHWCGKPVGPPPTIRVEKLLFPDLMTDPEYSLLPEEWNQLQKNTQQIIYYSVREVFLLFESPPALYGLRRGLTQATASGWKMSALTIKLSRTEIHLYSMWRQLVTHTEHIVTPLQRQIGWWSTRTLDYYNLLGYDDAVTNGKYVLQVKMWRKHPQQDRQCTHNATKRLVRVTIVAVEKL